MPKESTSKVKRPEKEKEKDADQGDAIKKQDSQGPPGGKTGGDGVADGESGVKVKIVKSKVGTSSKKKPKKVNASPDAAGGGGGNGGTPQRKHSKEKKAHKKSKQKSKSKRKIRTSPVGVPRRHSSHHSRRIVFINVEKVSQTSKSHGQIKINPN